jgi:choline dehydrogenase-like flavoprotein
VVPSALGVNPQLTIMALATRLAFHILGKDGPHAARPRGAHARPGGVAHAPPRTM